MTVFGARTKRETQYQREMIIVPIVIVSPHTLTLVGFFFWYVILIWKMCGYSLSVYRRRNDISLANRLGHTVTDNIIRTNIMIYYEQKATTATRVAPSTPSDFLIRRGGAGVFHGGRVMTTCFPTTFHGGLVVNF